MHKEPFFVASTTIGPDRKLSVPWFFRAFQDIAILDAEGIGYGHEKTDAEGLLWVLTRVRAKFHKMPNYFDHCVMETHPTGKKGFAFLRYGRLLDQKENVLCEISSVWALIHGESRHIELHPPLEDVNEADGKEMEMPSRIAPRPCKRKAMKTIGYSDLDLNGHMNNVRYIEMIMDLHEPEFYLENRVSEILINYESEIRFGETVELMVDESEEYVRGIVGDHVAFEALVQYEKN